MATDISKRLGTTRYVPPGAYFGQLLRPSASSDLDRARVPVYIGRGSESKIITNSQITLGYIQQEQVTFNNNVGAPYPASLDYLALGDKATAQLYESDGTLVDPTFWNYDEDINGDKKVITISSKAYKPAVTYFFNYQSEDHTAVDKLPVVGVEDVRLAGILQDANTYAEGVDFTVVTSIEDPLQLSGTGVGVVYTAPNAVYKGITRDYRIIVENAVAPGPGYSATAVTPGTGNTGAGVCYHGTNTAFGGTEEIRYTLTIASKANGKFNVEVTAAGINSSTYSGSAPFTITGLSEAKRKNIVIDSFNNEKITVSFDKVNELQNGDSFTFDFIAEAALTSLELTWYAEDTKGGSGEITVNAVNRHQVELENGVILTFADPYSPLPFGSTNYVAGIDPLADFVAGDEFEVTVVNHDSFNWSLIRHTQEVISAGDVHYDKSGAVTGFRKVYYAYLSKDNVIAVASAKATASPYADQDYTYLSNTNIVYFSTQPTEDITVSYDYRNKPQFGQTYYVTLQYTRPLEEYDQVIYLNKKTYADHLSYESPTNHLAIATKQAFEQDANVRTIAVIQVRDGDGDGLYNDIDYKRAVFAARYDRVVTDFVVLANFNSNAEIAKLMEERNDPFSARESLAFIGFPTGTPIGFSSEQEGTMAYYSKKVFQYFGKSPARGTLTAVANRWATRDIVLEDGSVQEVTLDGSFIAAQMAAQLSAFTLPAETLLRKTVLGFKDMEKFDDEDSLRVGGYSLTYLNPVLPIIRYEDVMTLDGYAADTSNLNAMCQKQFVTRQLRADVDSNVVGYVPSSPLDGISLIKSVIASRLGQMVSSNIIAAYGDGTSTRDLDPDSDIEVIRDEEDPTIFHLLYWYNLRYVIKKVFGVYSVDKHFNSI